MERTAKELYELLKAQAPAATKVAFDFLKEQAHNDTLHLAVYQAFEVFYRFNNKLAGYDNVITTS